MAPKRTAQQPELSLSACELWRQACIRARGTPPNVNTYLDIYDMLNISQPQSNPGAKMSAFVQRNKLHVQLGTCLQQAGLPSDGSPRRMTATTTRAAKRKEPEAKAPKAMALALSSSNEGQLRPDIVKKIRTGSAIVDPTGPIVAWTQLVPGNRVWGQWTQDKVWHAGIVVAKPALHVEYDDGDVDDYDDLKIRAWKRIE